LQGRIDSSFDKILRNIRPKTQDFSGAGMGKAQFPGMEHVPLIPIGLAVNFIPKDRMADKL